MFFDTGTHALHGGPVEGSANAWMVDGRRRRRLPAYRRSYFPPHRSLHSPAGRQEDVVRSGGVFPACSYAYGVRRKRVRTSDLERQHNGSSVCGMLTHHALRLADTASALRTSTMISFAVSSDAQASGAPIVPGTQAEGGIALARRPRHSELTTEIRERRLVFLIARHELQTLIHDTAHFPGHTASSCVDRS